MPANVSAHWRGGGVPVRGMAGTPPKRQGRSGNKAQEKLSSLHMKFAMNEKKTITIESLHPKHHRQ
jgi:hypothetical protein